MESPNAMSASVRQSRSPSPSSHSNARFDLTPRSKVQAMLALFDSDSDKENAPRPQPQKKPQVDTSTAPNLSNAPASSDEDSDIPNPRRKTAAAPVNFASPQAQRDSDLSDAGIVSGQRSSPSLFISPDKPRSPSVGRDMSGQVAGPSSPPQARKRLLALVARKKEELLAKEKERPENQRSGNSSDESSAADDVSRKPSPMKPIQRKRARVIRDADESESEKEREASRLMTQASRPTRKASKRAIEEMNRETQRMHRNMQLTHEARTKTKFAREDFLAKFNFRQPAPAIADNIASETASSTPPAASSEVEMGADHETPPSSPPSKSSSTSKPMSEAFLLHRTPSQLQARSSAVDSSSDDSNGPADLGEVLKRRREGMKGTPTVVRQVTAAPQQIGELSTKRASVRRFVKSATKQPAFAESEDELEIIAPQKPNRLAIFDAIPASKSKESNSLHTLRALAHINDSEKQRSRSKSSMTPSELQTTLRRRAREQALLERDEKIQRLRDKGVIVQTAEEKERDQMQLESMLEKARKEVEELGKKEKEAAKREGKSDGDMLDSEDDEEYRASDEEEPDDLSGSEDEEVNADEPSSEDKEDGEEGQAEHLPGESQALIANPFFDQEAAEDEEADEEEEGEQSDHSTKHADSEDVAEQSGSDEAIRPLKRRRFVVDDDEEDEEEDAAAEVKLPISDSPKPISANIFGFGISKAAGLGLSQVFAGTMAEEEEESQQDSTSLDALNVQKDSMAFLRTLPAPQLPDYEDCLPIHSPAMKMVVDSQDGQTPSRMDSYSHLSGPVNFDLETQLLGSELFDIPEPTQDDGFHVGDSQPALLEASHVTIATEPLTSQPVETPIRKRGRLQRRSETLVSTTIEDDDEAIDPTPAGESKSTTVDAFTRMREERNKAARTAEFNKKRSGAKEMVDEQAEESEDEYAGLGGASDDESQGELDEETRKIINDDGQEVTNERDIAAYYAEKARLQDEKDVEKLYKDVVNGGLRRKRGAQDDLFDSDDEDEAAARRRAAKQREFAKMRKALLADEKIGKIAANPKQAAFLHAIEDRDDLEEIDAFDEPEESFTVAIPDSQDATQAQPSSSANTAGGKRKHSETTDDGSAMAPPPNPRRVKVAKLTRPTSLEQIRNTLSEIIGEPESILESQAIDDMSDHSEPEDSAFPFSRGRYDHGGNDRLDGHEASLPSPPPEPLPRNPRRTQVDATRTTVIDRMALKRQASSLSISRASTEAGQTRLAFHTTSAASFTFKVPSLLRRATTNSLESSSSSGYSNAAPGAAIGGLGGKDAIKRGGTAKSSVNYYVRDMERKAKLEKRDKERTEGRLKVGKMRRVALAGKDGRSGGLGGLVGGEFE